MRDSQKQKVYNAEVDLQFIGGIEFKDIDEVQRYVDRILKSRWWAKNADRPGVHIEVEQRRGYGGMAYGAHRIRLGRHSLRQPLLLHELAHCGAPPRSLHGWQFCDFYLRLVRRFMGREAWLGLRAGFKGERVRFHHPRTVGDNRRPPDTSQHSF